MLTLSTGAIPSQASDDPLRAFQRAVESASEEEAYATALEAYLYGYPRVEMARRMHNETRRVAEQQAIYAPPNSFHYFDRLARPGDGLVIKAPNNDTLYASGYLDLAREPVILRVPPMGDRYYVALVADAAGGVGTRVNSRVTGTGGVDLMFAGPAWQGTTPAGVRLLRQATNDLWLLMRVASTGEADGPAAASLLQRFVLAPLSQRGAMASTGRNVSPASLPVEAPLQPFGSQEFFRVLGTMLQRNPLPAEDRVLGLRWQRIGLSESGFQPEKLSPAVRQGMERALVAGERIVQAAQFGIANNINGWNYSDKIGRIRNDWALNAAIARGGYGNLAEDSVYHQRNVDDQGRPLTGQAAYTMTFAPGQLPPVGAFWSLTAYDQASFDLIENPIRRYSFGDRTPGLKRNADGSLTLALQGSPPTDPTLRANWLPVGDKPFYLIMRSYDPAPEIASGRWAPPPVVRQR
jgi:hypothetical protein